MELHAEGGGQVGGDVEEEGRVPAASVVTLDLRLRPPDVCVSRI